MKTDHPICLFLSAGTEAFQVLNGGQRLDGAYRFCSLTLKGLERRIDQAPIDQLNTWLDGVLDTPSLEALLGSEHAQAGRHRS